MLGRRYISRQAATLIKFARSVSNPELSAALIEKAAALKSQLDQHPTDQDIAPSAPDVQAEPRATQVDRKLNAIELIVDGYISLKDRQALQDLKAHRELLASELKARNGWFDYSASIEEIEDEIAVIQTGLARLNSPN